METRARKCDPAALGESLDKIRRCLDRIDRLVAADAPAVFVRNEYISILGRVADWLRTDTFGIGFGGLPEPEHQDETPIQPPTPKGIPCPRP